MVDREKLLGVVLGGFVAGLLASAIALAPKPRVDRIAQLFEEICIPSHFGQLNQSPEVWGFETVNNPDGSLIWIDPQTVVHLSIEKRGCRLETLAPYALSEKEALQLLDLVETIVEHRFPNLPYDPASRMGSINKAWMTGDIGSSTRWGVAFFAYPDWGDGAGSILALYSPLDR